MVVDRRRHAPRHDGVTNFLPRHQSTMSREEGIDGLYMPKTNLRPSYEKAAQPSPGSPLHLPFVSSRLAFSPSGLLPFISLSLSLRRLPGRPSPLYTRRPGLLRRRRAATRYAYAHPPLLFPLLPFLLCETELPNPNLSYLPIPIRI